MTPIEGIDYCSTHDDVWLEDEQQCQAVYFKRAENEDECVGHPLWWGDLRAQQEAIIDYTAKRLLGHCAVARSDIDAIIAAEQETP